MMVANTFRIWKVDENMMTSTDLLLPSGFSNSINSFDTRRSEVYWGNGCRGILDLKNQHGKNFGYFSFDSERRNLESIENLQLGNYTPVLVNQKVIYENYQ
jgi:hypothetical protein